MLFLEREVSTLIQAVQREGVGTRGKTKAQKTSNRKTVGVPHYHEWALKAERARSQIKERAGEPHRIVSQRLDLVPKGS